MILVLVHLLLLNVLILFNKVNSAQQIKDLKISLKTLSNRDRAFGEKKYLKSTLRHYGVTVPRLRRLASNWISQNPQLTINQLVDFSNQLWDSPWHEERMLAMFILVQRKNELAYRHLPQIEHMINTATNWAQLDGIAVWLVGSIIDSNKRTLNYLTKWIKSDNFWVRRAAILAQIIQFRQGRGDMKLFQQLAQTQFPQEKQMETQERFFIRKAIGWALRERVVADPNSIFQFVTKFQDQISSLTYREATRKLPSEYQTKLSQSHTTPQTH